METIVELLKAVVYGLVEGITEWLPVSSTGHMILLDALIKLKVSEEFFSLFLVVIQLGAILAVILTYWEKIWPFYLDEEPSSALYLKLGQGRPVLNADTDILNLWGKILVCCIPAILIGVPFGDTFDELFYKPWIVALALILFGAAIIATEYYVADKPRTVKNVRQITYKIALLLGLFQLVAAIFPGASRSGMMVIGALLLGLNRRVACRFTFYVAIPVMVGASLLKLIKYFGNPISGTEILVLIVGMSVAFLVSMLVIRVVMNYIRTHSFKPFGYYRIGLGLFVLIFFLIKK